MGKYYIYEHVSPNGKRYIGQTCQRLSRRWRNGNGYVRNKYFFRAIKKYGWDAFKHNVICECGTLEEANRVESDLIEKHKTNDPKYGYNISGGADGRHPTAEITRRRLSLAHKGMFAGKANPCYGRKHTPEEREKMSVIQKKYFETHRNPRLGTKATDETRRRLSESRRKSKLAQEAIKALNQSKSKKVLCKETGVVYPSAREAARQTGYGQGNISAVCRGEYKQAYGFHWVYV